MKQTIMVVDDSTSLRMMMAFTLGNAGYSVIEAENGLDSQERLNGSQINMFIVDLNMPHVDGFELIRSIRGMSQYKFTPILILTTESLEDKIKDAKATGATGLITKPFKPDQLIDVIQKLMPAK